MARPLEDHDFRRRMERLDSLLCEVETFPDPETRGHVREMVQSILELHAVGLTRMLEQIAGGGETGAALVAALADLEKAKAEHEVVYERWIELTEKIGG